MPDGVVRERDATESVVADGGLARITSTLTRTCEAGLGCGMHIVTVCLVTSRLVHSLQAPGTDWPVHKQATHPHTTGTPSFTSCTSQACLLALRHSCAIVPRSLAPGPPTQAPPTWPSQQGAFQQLAQQDLAHPVAAWSRPHLLGQVQGSLEGPWQRGTPAHQQQQGTPAHPQQRGRQEGWSTRLASALPVLQTCR